MILAKPSSRIVKVFLCTFLLAHIGASTSRAILLTPGHSTLALPSVAGFGATETADETLSFGAGTFSGTLRSTVWSDDPTNYLGGLTFAYFLTNDSDSADALERLALSSFGSFKTDVSWAIWYHGAKPTTIERSASGSTIDFNFPPKLFGFLGGGTLDAGDTSVALVVRTNAHSYHAGSATIYDGSIATVGTYAPIGVATITIPEPATLTLAVIGAVVGAWFVWKRRVRRAA